MLKEQNVVITDWPGAWFGLLVKNIHILSELSKPLEFAQVGLQISGDHDFSQNVHYF